MAIHAFCLGSKTLMLSIIFYFTFYFISIEKRLIGLERDRVKSSRGVRMRKEGAVIPTLINKIYDLVCADRKGERVKRGSYYQKCILLHTQQYLQKYKHS